MISDKTDNITLGYLLNPLYQTEIFQKKQSNGVDKDDMKFYRKRISGLSREIMRGKVADTNVKDVHDEYVKAAIHYFKTIDKSDILQDNYVEHKVNKDKNLVKITNQTFKIEHANECLFENKVLQSSLDNFVTCKKTESQEVIKHPQTKKINLRADELRLKGLSKKISHIK